MEENIKETTNPVFNTAKFTLTMLAGAGVDEAKDYLDILGFTTEQTKSYGMNMDSMQDKAMFANYVIQEARYRFINRCIDDSDTKNVLDIACGFSPRGLKYAEKGYTYVGADLPATVELLQPIMEAHKTKSYRMPPRFIAADATNPASLRKLGKNFEGPVNIVIEGLLMYLTENEIGQMLEGIKLILKECGGYFYTPDFSSAEFYFGVMSTIMGKEAAMKLLYEQAEALQKTSDAEVTTTKKKSSADTKADNAAFFESKGLKIESIPFYERKTELVSLKNTDPDVAEKIKSVLENIMVWKVTLKEDAKVTVEQEQGVSISGVIEDGILKINLSGRIDSVSAPDFLNFYNEKAEAASLKEIVIDCSRLQYISSAGLRVLLMMKKSLDGGSVILRGTSGDIREILSTTGFDNVVEVERVSGDGSF